jgi:hypothetical protein
LGTTPRVAISNADRDRLPRASRSGEEDEVLTTMIEYLYGDSTPSPLTTDYIAYLQNVFDFSIEVLLHENRANAATQAAANLSDVTDVEVFRADEIVAHVFHALEQYPTGDDNSIAARCACQIRQGVEDLVRAEARAARAVVAMEKGRAKQVALLARAACARALEALVLRQDLLDSVVTTKVWLQSESHYVVRRFGETPYGLKWTVEVEVPASHALARALRMGFLAGRLEIEAPALGGWFHKRVQLRRQRFDRLYLVELVVDPTGTTMKLRATPQMSSAGYDVSLSASSSRVQVLRIQEGGVAPDSPYEVSDEDAAELRSGSDAFVALIGQFPECKQVLVTASLDETPLYQLETPHLLVERIIGSVAPIVEQISNRSLVPGELSLKRAFSETQREEVFVRKAELLKKLEPLPPALRQVFDPLKLWEGTEVMSPARQPASISGVHEVRSDGTSQGLGVLSAGVLQSREWDTELLSGVSSTGKWPALDPPSSPLVET